MDMSFIIFFLGFLCALAALISIVIWSLRCGISPMPTTTRVKLKLLTLLPDEISGEIYELGAGWGTLAFPLARHYPLNLVIGFETSPFPFLFCKLRQRVIPLKNLTFKRANFLNANLQKGGLIVCYLYPQAMVHLKNKFEKELKTGTWIISNTFAIPDWKPIKIYQVDDLYQTKIYLYKR